MAIKIIDADDLGKDGYLLTIDLDADKPTKDPEPVVTKDDDGKDVVQPFPEGTYFPSQDAARTMTLTWGSYESSKNPGETKPQYLDRIKKETKLLARDATGKRVAKDAPRTKVAALVGQDIT